LVLSGNNFYTGGFKITSRGVTAGHKNAFGTGPLTIGDAVTAPANPIVLGASTPLTGVNAIPNAVTVNQNFTMDGTNDMELSGPVALGAITRIINVTNTSNSILSGAISSSDVNAGLTKDGVSPLVMSGASSNTYTGPTTVMGGDLRLNKAGGAAAIAGPVTVGDGVGSDSLTLLGPDQIADASAMTLAGGSFNVNNNNEVLG